ncbi:MAG: CRISPR-associated protein Cas4 [Candidatus Kapabacteria bacterium]|nr:CRISPR-associated protein Cas4 [Candidatus Kapabacteria bacterium]
MVCPRKLWLFSKDLDMEHTSEYVELGRFLHESTFARHEKEILIDRIKIDFSRRNGTIHEVKKSDAVEEAHIFQVLYYRTTSNTPAKDGGSWSCRCLFPYGG